MQDDVLFMVKTVVDVTYQTNPCLEVGLLLQFSAASTFAVGLVWSCLPLGLSPFSLPPDFSLFLSRQDLFCFAPIFTSFIWYGNDPKVQTGQGKA